MVKSIYVGNLPFSASETEIRDLFGAYGDVQSVKFINDRETGRFRGFGFVEMNESEANEAIRALNGSDLGGRALKVNLAQEKPQRQSRW
ncbi:MAG: RNA-binding protein [Thermodesulfobacteriota bacterium]